MGGIRVEAHPGIMSGPSGGLAHLCNTHKGEARSENVRVALFLNDMSWPDGTSLPWARRARIDPAPDGICQLAKAEVLGASSGRP
eukprot:6773457-Pyramimonas_sp.AAC.1